MKNMRRLLSVIFSLSLVGTLSGCIVLDNTDKVTITKKCLELTEDSVLFVKNCPACKATLSLTISKTYTDKKWEILDGSTRTFYKKMPRGTKVMVTEVKIVKGITDGPPFYVKGAVFEDSGDETFEIPYHYLNYDKYPNVEPTGRYLRSCAS